MSYESTQSLKKLQDLTKEKTPSFANKLLNRQLFSTDSKTHLTSTDGKSSSNLKFRLAGSARRSLGFLKKACSSASLNKFNGSRIPRPVPLNQQSLNLVVNKSKTEVEVFKQVAEILSKPENTTDEDKIVEVPIQALKVLYDTPNRDKILKSMTRTPIVTLNIDIEQPMETVSELPVENNNEANKEKILESIIKTPVASNMEGISELSVSINQVSKNENENDEGIEGQDLINFNDSIDGDAIGEYVVEANNQQKNENGLENELAKQNQIEVLENEILVNKTPVNIKENENKMLKMIEQQQQQRSSTLKRTSEIISPFAMNNVFKGQNSKLKQSEVITPNGLKNLFKQHKVNEENLNEIMSPYAIKNLFRKHQENIVPDNLNASPFTMKNLFKEHNKKAENGEISATPYTMKNLFKQHQVNQNAGDIDATPFTMRNLFKKDSSVNNENLSPVALKCLFRNKILNKQHLMFVESQATPLSMKNLFKQYNKKQMNQNLNAILSPTVFNAMFDDKNNSPAMTPKVESMKKMEELKTPIEKLDLICDKIINNEIKIDEVKEELLKVDNSDLINHIIDLKQHVKALEGFSDQLVHSINETIEEIDEQMSIQYPDDVEIEEEILSVDCITDNQPVILERCVTYEESAPNEEPVIETEAVAKENVEIVTEAVVAETIMNAQEIIEIINEAAVEKDDSISHDKQSNNKDDVVEGIVEVADAVTLENVQNVIQSEMISSTNEAIENQEGKNLDITLPIQSDKLADEVVQSSEKQDNLIISNETVPVKEINHHVEIEEPLNFKINETIDESQSQIAKNSTQNEIIDEIVIESSVKSKRGRKRNVNNKKEEFVVLSEATVKTVETIDVIEPEIANEEVKTRRGRGKATKIEVDVVDSKKQTRARGGRGKKQEVIEEQVIDAEDIEDTKPLKQRAARGKQQVEAPKEEEEIKNDVEIEVTTKKTRRGAKGKTTESIQSEIVSVEAVPEVKTSGRRGKKKAEEKVEIVNNENIVEKTETTIKVKKGKKVAFDITDDTIEEPKAKLPTRGKAKKVEPEQPVLEATATTSKGRGRNKKAEEIPDKSAEELIDAQPQTTKKTTRTGRNKTPVESKATEEEKPASTRSKRKLQEETDESDIQVSTRGRGGKSNKKTKL